MQAEREQQYNGQRERESVTWCKARVQAVSTPVPHTHRCVKMANHKLNHSCSCFFEWSKEPRSRV